MQKRAGGWLILSTAAALAAARLTAYEAVADERLIREVDGLRATLPLKDPNRLNLTLRLADLIFDEVNALAKKIEPTAADQERLTKHRRRAISLYKEALEPPAGSAVAGLQRIKVEFQLARLHADLGNTSEANALWDKMAAQDELKELKREATLRLAEYNEGLGTREGTARADSLYVKAISLCGQSEGCYYPHYRRAWMFHRAAKTSEAIAELRQALWDSKGQVREEALRDLILFHATAPATGSNGWDDAIAGIEDLSNKIQRPSLLQDLANAYLSSGNKVAGVRALEVVNSRKPDFRLQIRLMEELYGLRRWDDMRRVADQAAESLPKESTDLVEEEKILRRLTVQLDGERISQPEHRADFQSTVNLYLAAFPKSSSRVKMIEGWLAAETQPEAKMERLKTWIADAKRSGDEAEERKWREMRAGVAQKEKAHEIVAEEMAQLEGLVQRSGQKNLDKAREFAYIGAKAQYDLKKFDSALEAFKSLAEVREGTPDRWAVMSQHLALDVLNQGKRLGELVVQAESWTKNPRLSRVAAISKDLGEMDDVANQARFELAIAQGQNPESLKVFETFCEAGKFKEKACENARVLAVQLKDEDGIIRALRRSGNKAELAAELEASGRFAEAAELSENKDIPSGLKMALLRELAAQDSERDKALKALQARSPKSAPAPEMESALLDYLADARVLDSAILSWPLSEDGRARAAHSLEVLGKGSPETRKRVLASVRALGPAWSKIVKDEAGLLDKAQRAQTFHGKNSRKRFEARLAGLKKLATFGDRYLPGADMGTRAALVGTLAQAHADLADEILRSPIPEGLDAPAVEQVRASLREMAEPFVQKSVAYRGLVGSAAGQTDSGEATDKIGTSAAAAARAPASERSEALARLAKDPSDRGALESLRDFYRSAGKERLALYFEGRLRGDARASGKGENP